MTSPGLLKRGSVAIMTGLLAIPLVAMTGAAIDLARVWLVKSRLQMSLDAAVLVVARDLATGGTSADGLNLFWANFGRTSTANRIGYMGTTATDPIVHNPAPGGVAGSVQLTSSAIVTPTLLGIIGIGPVTVNGASTAQSAAYGLELALVLDNTGSMAGVIDDVADHRVEPAPEHPLWRRRHAAASLGRRSCHSPQRSTSAPPTPAGWQTATLDQNNYSPSAWMGCVMARTAKTGAQDGDDFNDKTPAQAAFKPFLYASTYHDLSSYTNWHRQQQGHALLVPRRQ